MIIKIDFNKPIVTDTGKPLQYFGSFDLPLCGKRHAVGSEGGLVYWLVDDWGLVMGTCGVAKVCHIRNAPEPPKKLYEEGQRFTNAKGRVLWWVEGGSVWCARRGSEIRSLLSVSMFEKLIREGYFFPASLQEAR